MNATWMKRTQNRISICVVTASMLSGILTAGSHQDNNKEAQGVKAIGGKGKPTHPHKVHSTHHHDGLHH